MNAIQAAKGWGNYFNDSFQSPKYYLNKLKGQGPYVSFDLHAHPNIKTKKDLLSTVKIMLKNRLDVLAVTEHGKDDTQQIPFDDLKELALQTVQETHGIAFNDMGGYFQILANSSIASENTPTEYRKPLSFLPAREHSLKHPNIKGKFDIVALMPDSYDDLDRIADENMNVLGIETYTDAVKAEHGLALGAHPYVIWDPHGPLDVITFRLAEEFERNAIIRDIMPMLDGGMTVASAVFWMTEANRLFQKDYKNWIGSSDTHAVDGSTRKELNKGGFAHHWKAYFEDAVTPSALKNRIALAISGHKNTTNIDENLQHILRHLGVAPALPYQHYMKYMNWMWGVMVGNPARKVSEYK